MADVYAACVGRFYEDLARRLVHGAQSVFAEAGSSLDVHEVPGAFELPQMALRLARRRRIDAVVCVGCIIRGETPHFEYVAGEAVRGIGEAGRLTGVPVTFGVITADTRAQADARAGGPVGNRGEEAALAAVEMVLLFRTLRADRRTR